MLLTDLNDEVFEINANDIRELHTRHGANGDYTLIATDTQLYKVKESVPYIMKLLPPRGRTL